MGGGKIKTGSVKMKFLVPVDFTDITNPLLKLAKLLALKHNASVILLHAVSPLIYLPYPESFGVSPIDLSKLAELEAQSIESAKKRLEALRDFLAELSVDIVVDAGEPSEVILAKEEMADLIILGSHRKGLVERILVGSTSEKVARYCHKPLLVLKGKAPESFKKVCLAHDLSKHAQSAFEFFLNLIPPEEDGKLTLLHVEETIELPMVDALTKGLIKKIEEEKINYLNSLLERAKEKGWKAELVVKKHSNTADGIVEFIKEGDYDLLVMGSRGLSGLKRVLLGSTSSQVLRRVEVPILIYKGMPS
jgi:nucleotide-binding universal stress UspA family protein